MEPERQIEKLLKAYAKKRLEKPGAPKELHPATRRLLQAEVARRAPRRDEGSFFLTVAAALRRRLVLASCVAAMVLAGVLLVSPLGSSKKPATLASKRASHPSDAGAPVAAPALEQAGTALDKEKTRSADSGADSLGVRRLENLNLKVAGVDQIQPHEAAIPGTSGKDAVAVSGVARMAPTMTVGGAVVFTKVNDELPAFAASQRYAQTDVASKLPYNNKNVPAPVLASFQVQQNNQEIRVVDQDGSVYNGYWQSGDTTIRNQAANAQQTPAAQAVPPARFRDADAREKKDRQQAAMSCSFRVAGMNQSLKQNVVFSGNLTAITSGVPLVQTNNLIFAVSGEAGGVIQNATSNQSLQLLLSNSRISGTAVIDSTKQIEINAVPSSP